MTTEQFNEGISYAEGHFLRDDMFDKKVFRKKYDFNGKKILDLGCGMGGVASWYARNYNCEVHGVDIDKHHITIAQEIKKKHKINNVKFENIDVLKLTPQPIYDVVTLNDVAEHIELSLLNKILAHLKKFLKKDGSIIITYPPWEGPYSAHMRSAFNIPWCQYLPRPVLDKLIEKNNRTIVGDIESDLFAVYDGLNRLTHDKLEDIAEENQLHFVYRKSYCILNRLGPLRNQNLNYSLFKYLITKEFVELKAN